jgi:hypothetical protein
VVMTYKILRKPTRICQYKRSPGRKSNLECTEHEARILNIRQDLVSRRDVTQASDLLKGKGKAKGKVVPVL